MLGANTISHFSTHFLFNVFHFFLLQNDFNKKNLIGCEGKCLQFNSVFDHMLHFYADLVITFHCEIIVKDVIFGGQDYYNLSLLRAGLLLLLLSLSCLGKGSLEIICWTIIAKQFRTNK